jgi:hypothetical protein
MSCSSGTDSETIKLRPTSCCAPPGASPPAAPPNRAATVRERNHHHYVCPLAAQVPCTFSKISSVFSDEVAFRCAAVRVAGGALLGGVSFGTRIRTPPHSPISPPQIHSGQISPGLSTVAQSIKILNNRSNSQISRHVSAQSAKDWTNHSSRSVFC